MRNFLRPALLVAIMISTVALGASEGRPAIKGDNHLHVVEDAFCGYEGFDNITGGLGGDGGADGGGGDSGKGTAWGIGGRGRGEVDFGYKGAKGGVGMEIHFGGRKRGADCGSGHRGGIEVGGGHNPGSGHGGGGDYNVGVGGQSVGDKI